MFSAFGQEFMFGSGDDNASFSALDRVEGENVKILTNLAQEYKGRNTIWPKLAPLVPSPSRNFRWFEFGKESFADTRAIAAKTPGKEVNAIKRGATPHVDALIDYWLATVDGTEERDEVGEGLMPLVSDSSNTELLNELADGWTELDLAELAMAAGTYDSDHKDTISTKWDAEGGSPVEDISTVLSESDIPYNTLVMTKDVFWANLRHADYRSTLATIPLITPDMLLAYWKPFGIEQILVGDCPVISKAGVISNAWGTGKTLLAKVPINVNQQNIKRPAFAYTGNRQGYTKVAVYNNQERETHYVRIWVCRKPFVTSAVAAHLLSACLST